MTVGAARAIRLTFQPEWDPHAAGRGLFSTDARVRTLVRVLVSYPEVRHVLPDRVSLEPRATPPLLESISRFLDRQTWLVRRVSVT
jgi:hypothetical protein